MVLMMVCVIVSALFNQYKVSSEEMEMTLSMSID